MDNERMERNVEQATASGALNENLNLNSITKCGVSSHELGLSDGANSAAMLPQLTIGEGKCGGARAAEHEANLPESGSHEAHAGEPKPKIPRDGGPKDEAGTKIPRDGGPKDKVGLDSYDGQASEMGSSVLKDKFSESNGGKDKDNLNDEGSAKDKLQLMKEKKAALLDGKPEAAGTKPELGKPESMIKKPLGDSQGTQQDSGKVVKEDGGVKPWFEKDETARIKKEKAADGGEKKDAAAVLEKKNAAEAVIEKKKDADAAVEKKDAAGIAEKKKDAEAIVEKKKEAEAIIEKKKSSMVKDDFIKKLPDTESDKTSLVFSNPYEESKEALRVQKLLQGMGKY